MLTRMELVELYRSLQDQAVLSVYVDTDQHDPAARSAWKTALESEVGRIRKSLSDNGGAEGFESAWETLQTALRDEEEGFFRGRGLVAFVTADGVKHMEKLPISTNTLVRWEDGLRVAPYVRALKQNRPIEIALADRERVRLFTYLEGGLTEHEEMDGDTDIGDVSEVGMAKRGSKGSGRRGETASDQAQRILDHETSRMLKAVAERLETQMGEDGVLILGGTSEAVSRLADLLPDRLSDRVTQDTSLHLSMSLPELKDAVRELASGLTSDEQMGLVDEVVNAARSGGKGSLGREETERALREMRVDTLLLSRDFLWENPDFADRCVGTAFAQNADVRELGGAAGERLDREGEGIGSRLRFRVRTDGNVENAGTDEEEAEARAAAG